MALPSAQLYIKADQFAWYTPGKPELLRKQV